MPFFIISLVIQAAFIVHVIKTGRNTMWIWILIIPYLAIPGMIAYLLVTLIPALRLSRQRYAEELVRHARYDDAIAQYRQALSGLYEHDPNLLLGLAQAQFAKGDASAARATLDQLIGQNPQFRSPAGHLLYARALEAEGNQVRALEEYRVVAASYPGAEAAVRYAQLLQAQGQREESQKVARELLQQARIAPGHYRRAQREWLEAAQKLA